MTAYSVSDLPPQTLTISVTSANVVPCFDAHMQIASSVDADGAAEWRDAWAILGKDCAS